MIRTLSLPALVIIAFGCMVAPAVAGQDELLGMKIAVENCSPCHSIGPAGPSPNRKATPFRNLSKKWPLEALEEALGEGIEVGHRGKEMPEFTFEPRDIGHLIAYLRTLSGEKRSR